jgi:hypothetical protein
MKQRSHFPCPTLFLNSMLTEADREKYRDVIAAARIFVTDRIDQLP